MATATSDTVLSHLRRLTAGVDSGKSDGELLRAFAGCSDQDAFALLLKRHGPLVLAVCRRVLRCPHDAEDAFQATFLLLAMRARALDQASSVGGWLHATALRVAWNARRAAGRRSKHEARVPPAQHHPDASSQLEWQEVLHLLDQEVRRLPDCYREPFILCCLEAQEHGQAARRLNLKQGTLWSRLSEARRRLRTRLHRYGIAVGIAASVTESCPAQGTVTVAPVLAQSTVRIAALVATGGTTSAKIVPGAVLDLVYGGNPAVLSWKAALLIGGLLLAASIGLVAILLRPPFADVVGAPVPQAPAANANGVAPTAEPAPASLSGRVLDPAGTPLGGARVWLEGPGQHVLAECRTAADGRFRLEKLAVTRRLLPTMLVEAPDLARWHAPQPALFPGIDHAIGDLLLPKGRVAMGQVVDAEGVPLAGAQVVISIKKYLRGHTYSEVGPSYDLVTAKDGQFRTPPLPVGHVALTFRHPECVALTQGLDITSEGHTVFEPIRLQKDVPLVVQVNDERGQPLAGVRMQGSEAVSDAHGRLVLRGYGPKPPPIGLMAWKPGYSSELVALISPSVTLKKTGYFTGRAVDAETGAPVLLKSLMICECERRPDGSVVTKNCSTGGMEQPEPGRFRIPYGALAEFHLTATAEGYPDAEVYTPRVTDPDKVNEVLIKFRRKQTVPLAADAPLVIRGRVTRAGQPAAKGWVALWSLPRPSNAPNAPLLRGRTTTAEGFVAAEAPIVDGAYVLQVPHAGGEWYVVVEEPNQTPTIVGPVTCKADEARTLDVVCADKGMISGRVRQGFRDLQEHLYVVAFTDFGYRTETRVAPDGSFTFTNLPPGKYGLKVGHDAYSDSDVRAPDSRSDKPSPAEIAAEREFWEKPADPWKRATVVQVETGKQADAGTLELP